MPKSNTVARPLVERIARARKEGRTRLALELAMQLLGEQPTEASFVVARQVLLEHGAALELDGKMDDAAMLYVSGRTLRGEPGYEAVLAERLAATGRGAEALEVAGRLSGADAVRRRVLGYIADDAVRRRQAPPAEWSAELLGQYDLVLRACAALAEQRDDEARAALQGIGLQSPFLEWKVLLRGLLAYYAGDDARALENWQRLDPPRLPARLAAPLRLQLDAGYRASQPPDTQRLLAQSAARLCGPPLQQGLHELQEKLTGQNLGPAFRHAQALLPELRRDFPALVPRLANIFFWAIINDGEAEDIDRYERVFGVPADDPSLSRLQALAVEQRNLYAEAHEAWQRFLDNMTKEPALWPAEVSRLAQALVWARLGDNAWPDGPRRPGRLAHMYDAPFAAAPLRPDAEACYRKSIKLAPERLESYLALFQLYEGSDEFAKAVKLGEQMLKRFPDHAATLEAMGELYLALGETQKAEELLGRALAANPLRRELRGKLARARQSLALELALARRYDEARARYDAALAVADESKVALLCQAAVLEMKAGDAARAAALLQQALAVPDQRLAIRYSLLCGSACLKLPPKARKECAAALQLELATAPTPRETLALLESAARQRRDREQSFHGQKKLEKDALKFVDRLSLREFDEPQLERLTAALGLLEMRRPLLRCLHHADRTCADNPVFALAWAEYYFGARDPEFERGRIKYYLERARQLCEALPRGERQQQLLEVLQEHERELERMCGFALNAIASLMESFWDDEEDEEP